MYLFSSFLDEKLNDVHTQHSDKQPSGVKCVTAEINIQNSETNSMTTSASNKAQTISDGNSGVTKTDLDRESTIDTACLIDSPVKNADKVLESKANEIADLQNESSSSDSLDGSRSSPVESLGKG